PSTAWRTGCRAELSPASPAQPAQPATFVEFRPLFELFGATGPQTYLCAPAHSSGRPAGSRSQPTRTGSLTREIQNVAYTTSHSVRATSSSSALLAPPRLVVHHVC